MSSVYILTEKELETLNKISDLPYNEWWSEIISQEGEEMDYKIVDFQKFKDEREEPSEWGDEEPTDEDLKNEEKYHIDEDAYEPYDEYEDLQDVYDELQWSEKEREKRGRHPEINWFGDDS